jgi:hypothetical protein
LVKVIDDDFSLILFEGVNLEIPSNLYSSIGIKIYLTKKRYFLVKEY